MLIHSVVIAQAQTPPDDPIPHLHRPPTFRPTALATSEFCPSNTSTEAEILVDDTAAVVVVAAVVAVVAAAVERAAELELVRPTERERRWRVELDRSRDGEGRTCNPVDGQDRIAGVCPVNRGLNRGNSVNFVVCRIRSTRAQAKGGNERRCTDQPDVLSGTAKRRESLAFEGKVSVESRAGKNAKQHQFPLILCESEETNRFSGNSAQSRFVGSSENSQDLVELIVVVPSSKQRHSRDHSALQVSVGSTHARARGLTRP